MRYQEFHDALMALGATNRERARALGVPLRTFFEYKAGRLLPKAEVLLRHPDLYAALRRAHQGDEQVDEQTATQAA